MDLSFHVGDYASVAWGRYTPCRSRSLQPRSSPSPEPPVDARSERLLARGYTDVGRVRAER